MTFDMRKTGYMPLINIQSNQIVKFHVKVCYFYLNLKYNYFSPHLYCFNIYLLFFFYTYQKKIQTTYTIIDTTFYSRNQNQSTTISTAMIITYTQPMQISNSTTE